MLFSVLVDFRKRGVRSVSGHAILRPGCLREEWKAPAKTCSLRQVCGHGYGEAHFPRRYKSENGMILCAELSACLLYTTRTVAWEYFLPTSAMTDHHLLLARILRQQDA